MAEIVWRPQALRDLEAIEAYYEEVAPDFAPLFVAGAFEAAGRLSEFPNVGRVVLEIGDESIQELIYRQYRIIYVFGSVGLRCILRFDSPPCLVPLATERSTVR